MTNPTSAPEVAGRVPRLTAGYAMFLDAMAVLGMQSNGGHSVDDAMRYWSDSDRGRVTARLRVLQKRGLLDFIGSGKKSEARYRINEAGRAVLRDFEERMAKAVDPPNERFKRFKRRAALAAMEKQDG